jgi:hypothetical protein
MLQNFLERCAVQRALARVGAWAKVRDGRRDVNGKNAFLSRKVGQKSRAKTE